MEKPKHYLYHRVPEGLKTNPEGRAILYPLNILKEKFPELYQVEAQKYSGEGRENIPQTLIPTLEGAAWGDVIHLTAIDPKALKEALIEAGFNPAERKYYQVDPELLDPKKTTIYLYRDDRRHHDPENFHEYNPDKITEHNTIPKETKAYYKKQRSLNQRPLLFLGVPHIFHKGPIDVSNFPVITA